MLASSRTAPATAARAERIAGIVLPGIVLLPSRTGCEPSHGWARTRYERATKRRTSLRRDTARTVAPSSSEVLDVQGQRCWTSRVRGAGRPGSEVLDVQVVPGPRRHPATKRRGQGSAGGSLHNTPGPA